MMTRQLIDWSTQTPGRLEQVRLDQVPGRPLRPLPRTVTPYQDETLASYQRRLARANHLDVYHQLRLHLNEHHASITNPDDLATLTRQPIATLLYALPELRQPGPEAHGLALTGRTRAVPDVTQPRPACRRCTAARGISGEVLRWVRHDQNVCLTHRLWIGPNIIASGEQLHLAAVPDVVHAQRRHNNLIRRRGQPATLTAFNDATTIIRSHIDNGHRPGRSRLAALTGRDHDPGPDHPWLPLLTYPGTVALTSLLAQPHWRQLAGDGSTGTAPDPLRTEVHRCAGIGHPSGTAERDPLDTWWAAQRLHRRHCRLRPGLHAYAETVCLERWWRTSDAGADCAS